PSVSYFYLLSILIYRRHWSSTLVPYTTLFRSLVVDDDLGGTEVEQSLEPVVAVDHPSVEIVEVRSGETATVQLHHRAQVGRDHRDRKSTRLNSSHVKISYAVFCLKKRSSEPAE